MTNLGVVKTSPLHVEDAIIPLHRLWYRAPLTISSYAMLQTFTQSVSRHQVKSFYVLQCPSDIADHVLADTEPYDKESIALCGSQTARGTEHHE